ncbi:pirin family protein [Bacillus timonensis]|nr:pirin family protein [Bacillus timonensis]
MVRLKRQVKRQWDVKFEEMQFPAVQKGLLFSPEQWQELDPFILMAEDWFKRGTFSDHPHRGFQTITYVIDGRVEHIDNSGGYGILEAGDIQYMNAGSGVRHAEEAVDDDIAHTLQLWVNLPRNLRSTPSSYQDIYGDQTPLVSFEGGSVRVYAGQLHGVEGPLKPLVPLTLSEITLSKGATFEHHIPENHNAFLYVTSGEIMAGENNMTIKKNGVAQLTFNESGTNDRSELTLTANKRSKVLIYSAKPTRERIVPYGPFVMGSMEEIRQAFQDYHSGKFGLEAK